MTDPRISRLRALVAQLERLPTSTQRTRTLMDVRARIADVETGQETEAMRPLGEDTSPPSSRARPGTPARSADEPPSETPARRGRPPRATSPSVVPMPSPSSRDEAPRAAPDASPLENDGLLWLEDQADVSAESGNGATADAPWRRGLRG